MSNKNNSAKVFVQKIGTALSGMVMPNIGAFIAWGLITALFIKTGWTPNENLAKLVDPMIIYLLPLLIAYTAGYNIHKQRGGVVAAIATTGVIVGTGSVMFLGAMLMGPLAAWLMKKFDEAVQPKIKTGFEMLVNNFSAGFMGFFLSIGGYYAIGPVVKVLNDTLAAGVNAIVNAHLIPLANIFIEPAKILFLNNAINHGILTPLGTQAAKETGKSLLFLLEANPGVGLGILAAYMLFGKGASKSSSYGAAVIHFIGGIHEIYFPYILMKPALIIAAICGGVSGTATIQFFDAGLKAPASPGSIIAILGMTAQDSYVGVVAGVLVAAVVTFLIASVILKRDTTMVGDLSAAQAQVAGMKAESKGQEVDNSKAISYDQVEKIIFACDAGMGSSAMGASILREKIKKANIDLPVTNTAIRNLQADEKALIITQNELTPRAQGMNARAIHVSVDNFLASPRYDEVVEKLGGKEGATEVNNLQNEDLSVASSVNIKEAAKVILVNENAEGRLPMGLAILKHKFQKENINIEVTSSTLENLKCDTKVVIVSEKELTSRVQEKNNKAIHISLSSFLEEKEYNELVEKLK